jgi:copper chaperone CopZ
MADLSYYIPGISCNHCVRTISNELSELEGVQFVKVDLETKTVSIAYGPPADEQSILNLLQEINYPPQL